MAGCTALVVAGGRGNRFGGARPKQYAPLAGRPVLRHTVAAFLGHPRVDAVRVVIHRDDRDLYEQATAGLPLMTPVPGGETRQDSVRLGLQSLRADAPERVLIHDAARPFADPDLIARVVTALDAGPGVVPAIAISDTLKRTANDAVAATVPRDDLRRAQTPQGFRFAEILAAHEQLAGETLTDDAALFERLGQPVAVVAGSEDNFKITTADDLVRAERRFAPGEVRTGYGYDVHRFAPGDHVMLCGIAVPHEQGLAGHSDADVGLHALTDALLGAVGEGDIGIHFPPSDAQWRGAASEVFLAKARDLVLARGGAIVNVDLTLICERPKVSPHRDAMRERIAGILNVEAERVNVKGTTTEGLGFTGRNEGIAAQAVATVRLPAPGLVIA